MTFAVAKDEAFNFTYRANIDALRAEGDVLFFSPINDKNLPSCDILYLPGGYPELFADKITANITMRHSIKQYAERGGHIFAECGGFMYLCQDIDGKEMCGVLPLHATMQGAKLHLGYRQMENREWRMENKKYHTNKSILKNSPLEGWGASSLVRGHEFHYSHIVENDEMPNDITITEHLQSSAQGKPVQTSIYRYKNVIAGYTHWYWAETGFIAFYKNI